MPQAELLETLAALVDHSLVYRTGSNSQPAYAMLEPLREYALGHLSTEQQDLARQRHARYYLELLETATPQMRGGQIHSWAEQLQREHDNIRIALAWLLSSAQYEQAGQLCVNMRRFWWSQGHVSEGLSWIDRLTGVLDPLSLPVQGQLWYTRGMLAAGRSDLAAAEQCYRVALTHAQRADDAWVIGACASGLGVILAEQQRYAEAQQFLEQGLQIDRQLGGQMTWRCHSPAWPGCTTAGNYRQAIELLLIQPGHPS